MNILKTRVESIRKVPKLSAFLYNIFFNIVIKYSLK